MTESPLFVSELDRQRLDEIESLAQRGEVGALIERLSGTTWPVRRAAVAALARGGHLAVAAMAQMLRLRRDDEARIAALVDALSTTSSEVMPAVLQLAHDGNPAVVCDAIQILGRRRALDAIPLLGQLTLHADDNVAVAAIEALGRIGGLAVIDPLIQLVRSGSFFRTFPAIEVLGRSGDPRAVAALAALLDQPHYALEVARALGRLGDSAAVADLVKLAAKGNDAAVRAASLALAEIWERPADADARARIVAGLRQSVGDVDLVTQRLTRALTDADVAEQTAICKIIGAIGGESAVVRLMSLLDADPSVSAAAASALAQLGREGDEHLVAAIRAGTSDRRRALLPLVGKRTAVADGVASCLQDEDPLVRALACDALARIGDPRVVPLIFPLIGVGDPRVEQAAIGAIQSLGSEATKELTMAAARSNDPRLRRSALRIIAYFGYPEGLELLLAAIGEPDERIRDAALGGLPFMDDPRALEAALAACAHPIERTRATALRVLGQTSASPRVVQALTNGLRDPAAWVRYYACQALGRLHVEEATDGIVACLDDEAGQVRVAAVEALTQLRGERALLALHGAAASQDRDVRRAAVIGLGIAKRIEALPILLTIADSVDASTRLVALSALAEFAELDATLAIAGSTSDPDENVRNAAFGYLGTRPGTATAQAIIDRLGAVATRERMLSALSAPLPGRVERILQVLEDASAELAPLLVAALGRMGRADASAAIVQSLGFPSVEARRAAARALAIAPDGDALEALAHAADNDPDEEVRRLCKVAIAHRT